MFAKISASNGALQKNSSILLLEATYSNNIHVLDPLDLLCPEHTNRLVNRGQIRVNDKSFTGEIIIADTEHFF